MPEALDNQLFFRGVVLVWALFSSSLVFAQTTYRWIDPVTGQTVISDQAPPQKAKQLVVKRGAEAGGGESLPFATRQAAEKFPVTVYTTAACVAECKMARDLLNGRGVPFSEQMLQSPQDFAELAKKLGGDAFVPSLSVGRQYFRGFESVAWSNLLDLAGYPKEPAYGAKPSGAFAK